MGNTKSNNMFHSDNVTQFDNNDNDTIMVFQETEQTCSGINKCKCIERIIEALKHYEALNVKNRIDQKRFVQLCAKNRSVILNDYIHIINQHNDDLEQIYDIMIQHHICNDINCTYSQRHNRNRHIAQNESEIVDFTIQVLVNQGFTQQEAKIAIGLNHNQNEQELMFWRDLFDSIHWYLYHLYHSGFRIKSDDKINQNNEHKATATQTFDVRFANICNTINEKRKLQQTGRFTNDKFIVNAVDSFSVESQDKTFMDELYRRISSSGSKLKHKESVNLCNLLIDQEYDSEAIHGDIGHNTSKQTNIFLHSNQNGFDVVYHYSREIQLTEKAFSTGFTFYYWPHFIGNVGNDEKEQFGDNEIGNTLNEWNVDDLGGYKPEELYIEQKYENIKEEILINNVYNLSHDQLQHVLIKATHYIDTIYARKIKAAAGGQNYGIKHDSPISEKQVIFKLIFCYYLIYIFTFKK